MYLNCPIVHDINLIVQSILYCFLQASCTYKYLPASSKFHSSSRIHSNNSQTTSSNPTNSTQIKSNQSSGKKTQFKDGHVFHQEHPRGFGHRCSHQLSPWSHGHGHSSSIRQSQQQPSPCRWIQLPMQGHEQRWRHRHKHGHRRLTETLLYRRGRPWWRVLSNLTDDRQPCDEELQMDGHSFHRGRLPGQEHARQSRRGRQRS